MVAESPLAPRPPDLALGAVAVAAADSQAAVGGGRDQVSPAFENLCVLPSAPSTSFSCPLLSFLYLYLPLPLLFSTPSPTILGPTCSSSPPPPNPQSLRLSSEKNQPSKISPRPQCNSTHLPQLWREPRAHVSSEEADFLHWNGSMETLC